ncbi:MAG: hypothetical protein MSC31_19515 [Solirubrobacteraceae bacterium MAG38_C4-C5]|nr:hypothetical protein [Candidatus Siliceabacter maunaloa]
MIAYYRHLAAWLDPEQSDPLAGGGRLQDVCLRLSDRADCADARPEAGIAMLACQARELAFELLELAEQADRQRAQQGRA